MGRPLALVTIYHTGACSALAAFRRAGVPVVPREWAHVDDKVAAIHAAGPGTVVWAHWRWIERVPEVLQRRVVTMLRDPVEATISAWLRNRGRKAAAVADQWRALFAYRYSVNKWIACPGLDFSWAGLETLPRENATGPHPVKAAYRAGDLDTVAETLGRHWRALMLVRGEIAEIFAHAGMQRLLPAWW